LREVERSIRKGCGERAARAGIRNTGGCLIKDALSSKSVDPYTIISYEDSASLLNDIKSRKISICSTWIW